jgi:hypothetical protein
MVSGVISELTPAEYDERHDQEDACDEDDLVRPPSVAPI